MWQRWVKALGVLSGTVLVHEIAHALAAKRVGGEVREIGLGFGPRLLTRRWGDTLVSLRPFLVGGFAAIDLETLPPRRRIPILLAGPLANLLIGLILLPRSVSSDVVRSILGPNPPRMQVAGMVGAMRMLLRVGSLPALRFLAAQINLSVGIANLLPLMPLDGGHLALAKMEASGVPEAGRDLYRRATAMVFIGIILQVLRADLRGLARRGRPAGA